MNLLKIPLLPCLLAAGLAIAAPGAHGPNGEHLDAPGGTAQSAAGARIETSTEAFELVGQLQGGELSLLIDRYETNEPVLGGQLEVEFDGMKAPAKFHAEHGDYSVDDAKFLEALAKPGQHALLFTLTAGNESDLLEGTLEVKAAGEARGHTHGDHDHKSFLGLSLKTWVLAGVLAALVLSGTAIRRIRRQSMKGRKA